MKLRTSLFIVGALGLGTTVALSQGDGSRAIVKYDGGEVTVGELEQIIARQSPFMRKSYLEEGKLEELLDKTVRFELLAREAERRGLGKHPDVRQVVDQNVVQILMKSQFDDAISAEAIPAEEVKEFYEANAAEFMRPALRRASQIVLATMDEAKAELAEVKDLDVRGFRERARAKSVHEASKLRGGDLRYFDEKGKGQGETTEDVPEAVARAVFALKTVGDVVPLPIKVEGGFAIVKLTGDRPAVERTLEQADKTIRQRLWRDRRQSAIDAFVAELQAKTKPEIHPELLSAIDIPPAAPPTDNGRLPPGFPPVKR
jgi:peptidyl-prolyl cis-trans isomerase C